MYDPHSRESRGFAFVTMENAEEAEAAIGALNGVDLMGRVLNVQKVGALVRSHNPSHISSRLAVVVLVHPLQDATMDLRKPRTVLLVEDTDTGATLHRLEITATALVLLPVTHTVATDRRLRATLMIGMNALPLVTFHLLEADMDPRHQEDIHRLRVVVAVTTMSLHHHLVVAGTTLPLLQQHAADMTITHHRRLVDDMMMHHPAATNQCLR